MKQSIFLKGLVVAVVALPLVAGCKKKEGSTAEGSAAPAKGSATPAAGSSSAAAPAAGSGSAAAAGSGSASTDPNAPWAADAAVIPNTSKVTGKRDGADKGTFDRAVFFKYTDDWGTPHYDLHIANGCEKFSCNYYVALRGGVFPGDDSYKACPDAVTMDIQVQLEEGKDFAVGPVGLYVSINGPSSGGGLSGDVMKGSTITSIDDKEVKGKIAVKDKDNEANGDFVAKNCGALAFPKTH
ncbi:MAG TPA: hypothetical protein VGM39_16290 [Kofleriaceae bacterium]|jgi:hypothetical protein